MSIIATENKTVLTHSKTHIFSKCVHRLIPVLELSVLSLWTCLTTILTIIKYQPVQYNLQALNTLFPLKFTPL